MTQQLSFKEFQETLKSQPVFVTYFSTPQCNVCKVLRPKVEELISKYNDIGFIYIDTELLPEIAGQFTVFSVPTIIIFTEGRENKRLSRSFSIDEIQDYLERLLRLLS